LYRFEDFLLGHDEAAALGFALRDFGGVEFDVVALLLVSAERRCSEAAGEEYSEFHGVVLSGGRPGVVQKSGCGSVILSVDCEFASNPQSFLKDCPEGFSSTLGLCGSLGGSTTTGEGCDGVVAQP
jgi:hypothetical protein